MFPEIFGRSLKNYRPFYTEYYNFRLKAEALPQKEIAEKAVEEFRRLKKKN